MMLLHLERSLMASHLLLTLGWVLFGIIHSAGAAMPVKKKMQQVLGRYFLYYRLGYSALSLLLVTGLLAFQFTTDSIPLWQTPGFLKIVFAVFAAAGLIIMFITAGTYFKQVSGVQAFSKVQCHSVLETGRLNRFVRHPLYAGTLLLIWSLLFFMPMLHHLLACSLITIYTLIGIKLEEQKLVAVFGEAYTQYQRKVPMIIPFM